MTKKRTAEAVVISDVHLGTYGCHAKELSRYLHNLSTPILILNGDIIDGWAFKKKYFPADHIRVIQRILKLMSEGTKVYYLTGNHDEMMRRFSGFTAGNLVIDDKLLLILDDKVHWFFHGDVFDITMKQSKWLAKLGGKGYDILIKFNRFVNVVLSKMGREKISLSKKIKNSVKQAVSFISDFEQTAIDIAAENEYDYVLCGHIHQPEDRIVDVKGKKIHYLNSGDWVENLTALEFNEGKWNLIRYEDLHFDEQTITEAQNQSHSIPNIQQLYENIVLSTGNR
ncbi:MAG: UDP-2,3-diacylglucosamine diphosphatase [Sphingobacteriales bacterium]|nr:MAG: UDP-2,3-diacylglucosamine diphosphatase [Sphingobacteriales bacterium]